MPQHFDRGRLDHLNRIPQETIFVAKLPAPNQKYRYDLDFIDFTRPHLSANGLKC